MTLTKVTEEVNKGEIDKGGHNVENGGTKTDSVGDIVEFDDLLSSAGEFGKYQLLLFISTAPFYVFGVFAYFTQLFLTEVSPNHWCWVPELENLTEIERRNLAVPLDGNSRFGYSHCSVYDANWTDVLQTGIQPNRTWNTIPCRNGWEFNKSEIPYPTISSDLGWVCDQSSNQATAQSIFFCGSMVGGILFGWVADRFGRLPATVVSNIIGCIGGVASIFARNFTEFALYRFFMGLGYDNCFMMVYLLVMEYIAPKYRTFMANASFALFYSTSVVSLPWIALACGHWKTLSLVTSISMAFAVISPFIIPESPMWLLSRGRVDEAVKKITKIGQINNKEVPLKLIEQFKISVSTVKKEEKQNALELIKRPVMRKMFICICLVYICSALVFDALVRSIGQLEFDFFISFSVVSATEFPSVMLLAFVMDWMGRRWLSTITLALSCVFTILIVVMKSGLLSVMCAVIARFFVNISYGTAMQWCAELCPTPVRGTGVAIVHICGFIGTILSPFIVYLDIYAQWLPLVIVGGFAAFGAVLALLLPETAKKDMPQTFEDAEVLYNTQRFWEMPFLSKKVQENGVGHINNSFEL